MLYSGSWDGPVRAWDIRSGACLGVCAAHRGPVWTLQADRGTVYSGSADGTVRARDFVPGEGFAAARVVCAQQYKQIWCLAVHGELLFTGGPDGFVRVWAIGSGACVTEVDAGGCGGCGLRASVGASRCVFWKCESAYVCVCVCVCVSVCVCVRA